MTLLKSKKLLIYFYFTPQNQEALWVILYAAQWKLTAFGGGDRQVPWNASEHGDINLKLNCHETCLFFQRARSENDAEGCNLVLLPQSNVQTL